MAIRGRTVPPGRIGRPPRGLNGVRGAWPPGATRAASDDAIAHEPRELVWPDPEPLRVDLGVVRAERGPGRSDPARRRREPRHWGHQRELAERGVAHAHDAAPLGD